ncbi:cuticle protein 76-like [Schistocerca serialis cubense]|uniref:cuticle protein 76-like n=1 Tax=Schistocerca serialis cubense TaxID=2023355 RepID=UPI00214EE58F|nr:cuticle protein 76-like [Schistocerca serialis cubense]
MTLKVLVVVAVACLGPALAAFVATAPVLHSAPVLHAAAAPGAVVAVPAPGSSAAVVSTPSGVRVAYAAPGPANSLGPVLSADSRAALLGVAYSAAPAVAHMTYSNALGISYAY